MRYWIKQSIYFSNLYFIYSGKLLDIYSIFSERENKRISQEKHKKSWKLRCKTYFNGCISLMLKSTVSCIHFAALTMQIIKPAGFVETSHYPLLLLVYVWASDFIHTNTHTLLLNHANSLFQKQKLRFCTPDGGLQLAVTGHPVARRWRRSFTWTGPRHWWAALVPSWCAVTGGAAASKAPTWCTASRRSWACSRSRTRTKHSGATSLLTFSLSTTGLFKY